MMKHVILLLITFTISQLIQAQADSNVFKIVDEIPIFQGSSDLRDFHKYINNNIDLSAINTELISGRIIVLFCIDSIGNTTDIEIIKSLRSDIDSAVINVVNKSPKWIPGKKDGRSVKVVYTLPMDFEFK